MKTATKVHFELVANILKRARLREAQIPGAVQVIDAIAMDFDREFTEMNRQFNSDRFLEEAGVLQW